MVELHIPVKTIVKVLLTALVMYTIALLAPLFLTLFLAIMLAVTLYPLLVFLRRKSFPNWVGVAIVIGGFATVVGLIFVVVFPPLFTQTSELVQHLPALRQDILSHLPASPALREAAENAIREIKLPSTGIDLAPLLSAGAFAASGATRLFLVMIFTVYLMVDGPRSVQWILAFFSTEIREKLTRTADETSKVVSAYVAGQIITSVICGVFTLVVLLVLDVPAAITLAVMAAAFDVLPVLGFFLAAVPAVLIGLTVSPATALLVLVFYVLYHAIENYLLVPKIYGSSLRLSDLVVLLSLLVAGTLAGIGGAIVVLPLVASYPIIERIWLVELLGRNVVKKHNDAAAEAAQ